MVRRYAPLLAALFLASCRSVPTLPVEPGALIAPGALEVRDPERARRSLEAAIAALGESPTARLLAAEWARAAGPRAVVKVNVRAGFETGSAASEGAIEVDARNLADPRFTAAVLAHEWLGHKLLDRRLTMLSGRDYSSLSTELLSRVRGWKVWLELDPATGRRDEELGRFVKLGPEAYRRWLMQPGRTYALSMTLADMREPEKFLRERLAAIREQAARESARKDSSEYSEWRRSLGTAPAPPKPKAPADEIYVQHKNPDINRILRQAKMEMSANLAEGLLGSKDYLDLQRKAAADPALEALAAEWDKEIADFHAWAKARW